MKLLLDTQAIIWWLLDDRKLSQRAGTAIESARSDAGVSVVSVWEFAIKHALGKISGPALSAAVQQAGLPFLRIDEHHAKLAGELPAIHRDPFDRMLVAQAMLEQLVIVTPDRQIARYGVPVVW